jgi:hypothetical protein
MGIVVNAVDKFFARRQAADKARGFSNQETEQEKRVRELKKKLDRSRGIK